MAANAGVFVPYDVWVSEQRRVDESLNRVDTTLGEVWHKIENHGEEQHTLSREFVALKSRVTLLITILLAITPALVGAAFTIGMAVGTGH
jgi:hypothetical protein